MHAGTLECSALLRPLCVCLCSQSASWNGNAAKGVRVKWDTGDTNVYRWGYLGFYDVQVCRLLCANVCKCLQVFALLSPLFRA